MAFFQRLGVLVKRGIVPLGLADDLFHGITLLTWRKTEKLIKGYREEINWNGFEEQFDYLYNKVKDYRTT